MHQLRPRNDPHLQAGGIRRDEGIRSGHLPQDGEKIATQSGSCYYDYWGLMNRGEAKVGVTTALLKHAHELNLLIERNEKAKKGSSSLQPRSSCSTLPADKVRKLEHVNAGKCHGGTN